MFKKIFILMTVLSTTAFAQSSFFSSTTTNTSSTPQLAPISPNSASPADFAKKVTQTNTDAQNQFKQQLNQKIDQTPPPKIYDADKAGSVSSTSTPTPATPTSSATTTSATPPPPVSTNSTDNYTGFQSSPTSTKDQKSGWDIKY